MEIFAIGLAVFALSLCCAYMALLAVMVSTNYVVLLEYQAGRATDVRHQLQDTLTLLFGEEAAYMNSSTYLLSFQNRKVLVFGVHAPCELPFLSLSIAGVLKVIPDHKTDLMYNIILGGPENTPANLDRLLSSRRGNLQRCAFTQ